MYTNYKVQKVDVSFPSKGQFLIYDKFDRIFDKQVNRRIKHIIIYLSHWTKFIVFQWLAGEMHLFFFQNNVIVWINYQ